MASKPSAAAPSTAAAPPPGPKKPDASMQFQIEAENEMQWRTLLRREGLIVIDVYASWAGPCVSMVSILKRVKVEVNDERLWYGMACSDNIDDLMKFKDQSEPCWLFVAGGKPIRVVRGSHAPSLIHIIKSEMDHEIKCIEGNARRNFISIDDEASRKKKIEAEVSRLQGFLTEVEEDSAAAETLNEIRRESSVSLMGVLESYTVAIIQPFVVENGQGKEIRDFLAGDFKIEQEQSFDMSEDYARKLYKIPYEVPEAPVEDFGYHEPTEENSIADDDTISMAGDEDQSHDHDGEHEHDDDHGQVALKPKVSAMKPRKKTVKIPLPDGLTGPCIALLLEHEEIKALANKNQKPTGTLLTTADDWLRLKVGPVKYKDAVDHAPFSLHATYGREESPLAGVWCPRKYDDKRFAILNFFPGFMDRILEFGSLSASKYSIAVLPPNIADTLWENMDIEANKSAIFATGKMRISLEVANEMLKSWSTPVGQMMTKKANLTMNEVFVVSFNPNNKAVVKAIQGFNPVHTSRDEDWGRKETAKLFPALKLPLEEEKTPEQILQKFLARSTKRIELIESVTELDELPVRPEVEETPVVEKKKKKSGKKSTESNQKAPPPSKEGGEGEEEEDEEE